MITKNMGQGKTVLIFDDAAQAAKHAASCFWDFAAQRIREQGAFYAAFSGGKSPVPFFNALARPGNRKLFECTRLFQVDERMVPADHQDSNQRLIMDEFVEPSGFPRNRFHPAPVHLKDAATAAASYETEIQSVLHAVQPPKKNLDFVLLGAGSDGHTASLFPEAVKDYPIKPLVHSSCSVHHSHDRITLGLEFVAASERVFFLITGKNKLEVAAEILGNPASQAPASMVWKKAGRAVMALDLPAARAYLKSLA